MKGNIIIVRRNGSKGNPFPISNEEIFIGRHPDCQIRVQLAGVAEQHMKITWQGEKAFLALLNPVGVQLNGQMITDMEKLVELKSGDNFSVAERSFIFEYSNDLPQAAKSAVKAKTPLKPTLDSPSKRSKTMSPMRASRQSPTPTRPSKVSSVVKASNMRSSRAETPSKVTECGTESPSRSTKPPSKVTESPMRSSRAATPSKVTESGTESPSRSTKPPSKVTESPMRSSRVATPIIDNNVSPAGRSTRSQSPKVIGSPVQLQDSLPDSQVISSCADPFPDIQPLSQVSLSQASMASKTVGTPVKRMLAKNNYATKVSTPLKNEIKFHSSPAQSDVAEKEEIKKAEMVEALDHVDGQKASAEDVLMIVEPEVVVAPVNNQASTGLPVDPSSPFEAKNPFEDCAANRVFTPPPAPSTAPSSESLLFSPKKTPRSSVKKTKIVKTPDILSPGRKDRAMLDLAADSQLVGVNDCSPTKQNHSASSAVKNPLSTLTPEKKSLTAVLKRVSATQPKPAGKVGKLDSEDGSGVVRRKLAFTPDRPSIMTRQLSNSPLIARPVPISPARKQQTPGSGSQSAAGTPGSINKVSFGPNLAPEVFDQRKPPALPMERGTPKKCSSLDIDGSLKSLLKKSNDDLPIATALPLSTPHSDDCQLQMQLDEVERTPRKAPHFSPSYIGIREMLFAPSAGQATGLQVQNLVGVCEMLKTPGTAADRSSHEHLFSGVKQMLQTPAPVHVTIEPSFSGLVQQSMQTPAATVSQSNQECLFSGLQQMLQTPLVSQPAADASFSGVVQQIMQTPAATVAQPAVEQSSTAVKSIKSTPAQVQIDTDPSYSGVEQMMQTPMQSAYVNIQQPLTGIKELMQTPLEALQSSGVVSSQLSAETPLSAVREMLQTPAVAAVSSSSVEQELQTPVIITPVAQSSTAEIPLTGGVNQIMLETPACAGEAKASISPLTAQTNAAPATDVKRFLGVREMFNTPRTFRETDLDGVAALVATPAAAAIPSQSVTRQNTPRSARPSRVTSAANSVISKLSFSQITQISIPSPSVPAATADIEQTAAAMEIDVDSQKVAEEIVALIDEAQREEPPAVSVEESLAFEAEIATKVIDEAQLPETLAKVNEVTQEVNREMLKDTAVALPACRRRIRTAAVESAVENHEAVPKSRPRRSAKSINVDEKPEEIKEPCRQIKMQAATSTTELVESQPPVQKRRGRAAAKHETDEEKGAKADVVVSVKPAETTRRGRKAAVTAEDENVEPVVEVKRRGRTAKVEPVAEQELAVEPKRRGRAAKVDPVAEKEVQLKRRGQVAKVELAEKEVEPKRRGRAAKVDPVVEKKVQLKRRGQVAKVEPIIEEELDVKPKRRGASPRADLEENNENANASNNSRSKRSQKLETVAVKEDEKFSRKRKAVDTAVESVETTRASRRRN